MRLPPKSILCASDLSPTGDGAVGLAYALAGNGTTVHLLHVNEPAFVMSPLDATVMYATSSAEQQKAVEERASTHLKGLVPDAATAKGVRTSVLVLHDTGPVGVIQREALRLGADVIVLGTRGRGGVARALLGSVADSVMKHSKVPVVLFHEAPPDE
jgi:nucleotide-binding universal stress UspA family protein